MLTFTRFQVETVAKKSFVHHAKNPEVIAFREDFDVEVDKLCHSLQDGTWTQYVKFRKLDKTNKNGKRRAIDAPMLRCRQLELLWLSVVTPLYEKANKNIGMARNCLPDHGLTAKNEEYSVCHALKHLFYDMRNLHYVLVLDQRQCYAHVTIALYRKAMKYLYRLLGMKPDKAVIDFGEKVCFAGNYLPIGTPSSPYIHQIVMLMSDVLIHDNTPWALRYADDNFMAFETKEELNAMKWRIYNLWWYEYHMRAKRKGVKIIDIDKDGMDFCGYVFHRNPGKAVTDLDKGYVTVRRSTVRSAHHATNRNWPCYFGIMRHADAFREMVKIEKKMLLKELTLTVRIQRQFSAPPEDIKELVGVEHTVYDYRVLRDKTGFPNWCQALIGLPELNKDGIATGKILAKEYHGSLSMIAPWFAALEIVFPDRRFLPIEEAVIENVSGGYAYRGSLEMIQYILPSMWDAVNHKVLLPKQENIFIPTREQLIIPKAIK